MARLSDDPIQELNAMPLVGLLLVLAVVFLFAAPPVTSSVRLPGGGAIHCGPPSVNPQYEVVLGSDAGLLVLTLNGHGISRAHLAGLFLAEGRLEAREQGSWRFRIEPDMPYGQVAELLAAGRQAGLVYMGVE
jgi:biopolymer transport protein ExbD